MIENNAECSSRILNRQQLKDRIDKERSAGKKIVLANGCFDIFHVGHARYLCAAKALGDFLVVGINSDKQVQALKGALRPIIREAERAEIIASLRAVDCVTVFPEATVEELIRAIRPDFHAKGTDYKPETVPEAKIVKECGGEVRIVGDPKNHSSSDIIARNK
ncbi:MAG: adenylyltransferase/cytidyltransferase family protein [Pyrinomonadaceae bacterium]